MRIGILLSLLIAGAAFCAQPDTPGDSSSVDLAARDTEAFHKLVGSLGGPASYPETRLTSVFDISGIHDLALKRNITHWYASAPHPLLASVLPGVSFVDGTYERPDGSAASNLYAITSDRRPYTVFDLNSLLRAEGFTFDSTEMQTIAKVTVLLTHFATPLPRADTPDVYGFDAPTLQTARLGTQAFPSIEFRSFAYKATEIPYGARGAFNTRLTVVYSVNGAAETAAVDFDGTTYGRNSLERFIAPREALEFQPGRVTPPPAAPPKSQSAPDSRSSAKSIHPDLVALGQPANYAATTFSDTWIIGSALRTSYGLDTSHIWDGVWHQSSPQQFLSQVFPEAKFFRFEPSMPFVGSNLVVFGDGRAYSLAQIASVLAAQGFSFDASELNVMAKVAVLFAYCGRRVSERRDSTPLWPMPHCAEQPRPRDNRAFPAIEFRALTVDTKSGVLVDCLVDGIPRSVFVSFARVSTGHYEPRMVTSSDFGDFYFFPQGGTNKERQGMLSPRLGQRGIFSVIHAP